MKTTQRKIRFFFAAQDQKEAEWLREMGKAGWRFESYSFFVYTFTKVESEDMVYQVDLFFDPKQDKAEYLHLFQEAGWELVSEFSGWHYFRQPCKEGSIQRIYSDKSSLIGKYQKMLAFTALASGPAIYFTLFWPVFFNTEYSVKGIPWFAALRFLMLIMSVLSLFNLTRLLLFIRRLKNENDA